ncbi:hypothetical protein AB0B25_03235 [Nocardia sp. NPDC049190]
MSSSDEHFNEVFVFGDRRCHWNRDLLREPAAPQYRADESAPDAALG